MSELNVSVATPERVSLDLPLAGIGSRAIAYIIDAGLVFLAGLVAYFIYSLINADILATLEGLSTVLRVALLVGLFSVMWIYWTAFEVAWNGQTFGKRLMKIRVVGSDGAPVTVFQSAIRNLLRLIDFMPFCYPVGLVCMLADARHRRLGDIAAGTILIREIAVNLDRYEQMAGARAQTLSSAELESVSELVARFDSLSDSSQLRLGRQYAVRLGLSADEADTKSAAELKAFLQQSLTGAPRG